MIVGSKPLGTVSYMGGVPALLEEFCWSWGQMVQYNSEIFKDRYIHYDRVKISDHAPARNILTGRFLGDWIVMLDTDHQFEPDLVVRLVRLADKYDLGVLSGTYRYKGPPYTPVAYLNNPHQDGVLRPIQEWDRSVDVLQVDATGAGCLFIRRNVLDKIKEEGEEPFTHIDGRSEDHSFFYRLKQLGIKVFWSPMIESYHLCIRTITEADTECTEHISEFIEVEGFK